MIKLPSDISWPSPNKNKLYSCLCRHLYSCLYRPLYSCLYRLQYSCLYRQLYSCLYRPLYSCIYIQLYSCLYRQLYRLFYWDSARICLMGVLLFKGSSNVCMKSVCACVLHLWGDPVPYQRKAWKPSHPPCWSWAQSCFVVVLSWVVHEDSSKTYKGH